MNKTLVVLTALMLLVGAGCTNPQDKIQQIPIPVQENHPDLKPASNSGTTTEQILTEKDFSSFGLSARVEEEKEHTFKVRINPQVPIYTFHVVSYTTNTPGYIEIFKDKNTTKPLQVIEPGPNAWAGNQLTVFFNVQDINFDGFSDIGVLVNGGATWGAYQYWIFDQKTGTFVTAPITEEFRKIGSNGTEFDINKKQVIAYGMIGAVGGWKSIYQFENGHLQIVEEYTQENKNINGQNNQTEKPELNCSITIKKYSGKEVKEQTKILNHECVPGKYDL